MDVVSAGTEIGKLESRTEDAKERRSVIWLLRSLAGDPTASAALDRSKTELVSVKISVALSLLSDRAEDIEVIKDSRELVADVISSVRESVENMLVMS